MSLEEWQVELRRQFGREQPFELENIGSEPLFSDYQVTNPASGKSYRVAVRGCALGENYCSCPDYAVNTLGTCKHIEFTLARLEQKRGAKTQLALGFQPEYSQVYLHYGARREIIFRAGTKCPAALQRYARRYFDDRGRLKEGAHTKFHLFLKKAGTLGRHEVRCYDDALRTIAEMRDREHLRAEVDRRFGPAAGDAAWKQILKVSLYPYQREGALFAAKAGRALIADDMGLGKTIQAIAAAEILARVTGIERVLIVSPTSLKHQWKQEIEKFAGHRAVVVEGLIPERRRAYQAEGFYKLVNYDVIHRDLEDIAAWQPDLVILDEAQRIKNWKTRTAQSVKQLQSPFAIVLTGTPLENRLEELHSIVEFVDRFRLGPMFRFLDKHQEVDETGRVIGYRNLSQVSKTLQPILVRRTKKEVLDELPERMDKQFFVPMTPQQAEHHEENRTTVARLVAKWRRYRFLSEADQLRMQIALQNMRMSCNSTYLLDHETDYGTKADELVQLLGEMLERPDNKVVIFSQWTRMHEIVAPRLEKRRWDHVLFHGGVPGKRRMELVRRFREDPDCRLFLATDAGGVGLNLQHASAVVILDQPWNPAVLEQRIGRVHRLGQRRPVRVVHFISQGTIEEGMLELLKFKKSVFSGVLDGGQDAVFLGGTRLKRFMESVETATGPIEKPALAPPAAPSAPVEPAAPARPAAPSAPAAPPEQLWSDLATAGQALLEGLGRMFAGGAQGGSGAGRSASGPPAGLLERDERTGQTYVKLPMPEPETLQKLVDVLAAFTRR
jgi:superfamily II DNA or RNA helicase